ncbi:MAG TPA: TonB family protein [Vicinamibacterales bacterium]|nr:TonB family protein [Vicinamibacterales bacterium]
MRALAMIVALLILPPLVAAQDDPLRAARDLYASAAYEEALAELARVASAAATPTTTRETDAYRTFCLVALGRAAEAQAVAESLVRDDPMLSIDQFPDVSPRIATMFADVRRRVLPQLIKDEYRNARALAVEGAPDAESHLQHVRQLLGTAEQLGAWDETLADVRMLVDGFLELAHTEPRSAPDTATAAVPAHSSEPAAIVSSSADAAVIAPTAVFQPQPNVPPALLELVRMLRRTSTIDVLINERGTVDDVTVTQSVTPAYDKLIVAAARTWRYKPALKDGVPIKFVSTVVINASDK